ncbi:hypothetical protein SETIT_4G049600v2 [Setaria italica]|uniref:Uncharacterized protein n=1 Tax=Setaria italica TaxID=4555 RepID=A0A368QQW3_SETIT|nr:hypothetical protein SETIT_4G049600v2 [Setaria italica]
MSGPKGEEIRYHDTISEIRFPYVAGDRAANSKILDQTAAKRSSHSLWSIQANPCLAYYFLSLTSDILSRSNNHDDVRAIEPEGSEEPSHAQ